MSSSGPPDRLHLSAYLGFAPARQLLGVRAPTPFTLGSMIRGGDRQWRTALRALGHEPAAAAACAVAAVALPAYLSRPDSGPEVEAMARTAAAALSRWRNQPASAEARADIERDTLGYALAVSVGGRLVKAAGFRGERLGFVLGKCASVVLAPENPRYVRWLGEAADGACHYFAVPTATLCRAVASAMLPYLQAAPDSTAGNGTEGM